MQLATICCLPVRMAQKRWSRQPRGKRQICETPRDFSRGVLRGGRDLKRSPVPFHCPGFPPFAPDLGQPEGNGNSAEEGRVVEPRFRPRRWVVEPRFRPARSSEAPDGLPDLHDLFDRRVCGLRLAGFLSTGAWDMTPGLRPSDSRALLLATRALNARACSR
jgi:hypothetical protein